MSYKSEHSGINCLCLSNGFKEKTTGIFRKPGMNDAYCLFYITEGCGRLTSDGVSCSVSQGQSFLAFPLSTIIVEAEPRRPLSYCWVEFKGLETAWIINQTSFSKFNPTVGRMPVENFERFFDFDLSKDAPYIRCRINSKLLMLLSYYVEFFSCGTSPKSNYALMACDYIENNFRNPECNVKNVADFIKIDRTYLYRLFKEETGKSIIDYINDCRISRAAAMLADKDVPIKDIAFSVGFTDQMYFSRVFKKLYGVTPTEYRKHSTGRH